MRNSARSAPAHARVDSNAWACPIEGRMQGLRALIQRSAFRGALARTQSAKRSTSAEASLVIVNSKPLLHFFIGTWKGWAQDNTPSR